MPQIFRLPEGGEGEANGGAHTKGVDAGQRKAGARLNDRVRPHNLAAGPFLDTR